MKYSILYILLLISFFTIKGQSPAGVEGVVVWLRPNSSGVWENVMDDSNSNSVVSLTSTELLNYNLVPSFKSKEKVTLPISKKLDRATYIIVFQPKDKKEKVLFQYFKNETKLSTKRFFVNNQNKSYSPTSSEKPVVASFVAISDSIHSEEDSIYIGKSWGFIDSFSGIIAELMIYDRVLTKMEREKIETYLSIKYSVPLDKEISLVSSSEDLLWEKSDKQIYGDEVFGFGSDAIGLYRQTKSRGSSSKDIVVSLSGASEPDFKNANYVLWSSNSEDFKFKTTRLKEKSPLLKKWEFRKISDSSLFVDIEVDTTGWISNSTSQKKLWLKHNQLENGKTTYQQANNISGSKHFFEAVAIDSDDSGQDFVSFVLANEMLFNAEVSSPMCDETIPGNILLEIYGGESPFDFTLTNEDSLREFSIAEKQIEIPISKSGLYHLKLKDKNGVESEEKISVFYKDGPVISLQPHYNLDYLGYLDFDFSKDSLNQTYSLYENDVLLKRGTSFRIKKPSNYTIEVENERECKSKFSFIVDRFQVENQAEFILYPNPTRVGKMFSVIYNLKTEKNLEAILYDSTGKFMEKKSQFGQYGHFNFSIQNAGLYFVKILGYDEEKSFKVIVH